jgi:hypothetical protein
MSEPFSFGKSLTFIKLNFSEISLEVAWDTSFEQLESLRARMLAFIKAERRDYLPIFDVIVDSRWYHITHTIFANSVSQTLLISQNSL